MTDYDSYSNGIIDGDGLEDGFFNGVYDAISNTSSGHDHDGTDSKRVEVTNQTAEATTDVSTSSTSAATITGAQLTVTVAGTYLILGSFVGYVTENANESQGGILLTKNETTTLRKGELLAREYNDAGTEVARVSAGVPLIAVVSLAASDTVELRWVCASGSSIACNANTGNHHAQVSIVRLGA